MNLVMAQLFQDFHEAQWQDTATQNLNISVKIALILLY